MPQDTADVLFQKLESGEFRFVTEGEGPYKREQFWDIFDRDGTLYFTIQRIRDVDSWVHNRLHRYTIITARYSSCVYLRGRHIVVEYSDDKEYTRSCIDLYRALIKHLGKGTKETGQTRKAWRFIFYEDPEPGSALHQWEAIDSQGNHGYSIVTTYSYKLGGYRYSVWDARTHKIVYPQDRFRSHIFLDPCKRWIEYFGVESPRLAKATQKTVSDNAIA